MCHMSIEKSRQREHELQIEMDRLQAEIKTLQIAAEESENISQQLSKQVSQELGVYPIQVQRRILDGFSTRKYMSIQFISMI